MAEQENMQIAQEGVEAWNTHDVERFVAILDEGMVWESDHLPETLRGREAVRQAMEMYLGVFPDLHIEIDQMIASGDYVVFWFRLTGTHRGELWGIQPTNRQVALDDCVVYEIRNGKLVHLRDFWDTATVLRQLGATVLPSQ